MVLGFDGSFSNDSTALVAVQTGDTPHIDVVACWERPPEADTSWRVPIADVEQAIRDACRRWTVREIVCDPFRWARTYQALEAQGLPIVEFPQSPQRMTPATQRFYEAVLNAGLTHSGDPRLARHIDNCVLKVDARGSRLAKDTRNSPRRSTSRLRPSWRSTGRRHRRRKPSRWCRWWCGGDQVLAPARPPDHRNLWCNDQLIGADNALAEVEGVRPSHVADLG